LGKKERGGTELAYTGGQDRKRGKGRDTGSVINLVIWGPGEGGGKRETIEAQSVMGVAKGRRLRHEKRGGHGRDGFKFVFGSGGKKGGGT